MSIADSGYRIIVSNEKETCTEKNNNKIDSKKTDWRTCETFCEETVGCKFYFFNEDGFCALYADCDLRRVAFAYGSTYQKINGIKIDDCYLCRNYTNLLLKIFHKNVVPSLISNPF